MYVRARTCACMLGHVCIVSAMTQSHFGVNLQILVSPCHTLLMPMTYPAHAHVIPCACSESYLMQCDEAWKLPTKPYGTGSGNVMGKKKQEEYISSNVCVLVC
jgi:hypothetical protein